MARWRDFRFRYETCRDYAFSIFLFLGVENVFVGQQNVGLYLIQTT